MAEHPAAIDVDVAIAGAGPVGAAFALFLRERGMPADRIALFDARTADAAAADDRMIAISEGSATLLARLGAWHDGDVPRATAIRTIHVSHRGRFGRTVIDARDYGVAALGHVVRHGDLTRALDVALAGSGVVVRRPVRVAAVDADADALRVTTDDAGVVAARHVVHAEGGLFGVQARRAIHRDYGQSAVTTFVTCVEPASPVLEATAFERFTEHGPIALLPAFERDRRGYAVVWCGTPDDSAARAALPDDAFVDALHAAFGDRLGRFVASAPRRTYPLGLNAVDRPARARTAHGVEFAIGNAAQTLHPVAGQGLNLGLRDAHALAALLTRPVDVDARTLASRFVAARRTDRATTVNLTDFMPRAFASTFVPVPQARGLTLALLDAVAPLRGVFARQMMNGRR